MNIINERHYIKINIKNININKNNYITVIIIV